MHIMEKNLTYPQRKRTPSFSSTLLDSIYRSIDESKSNLDKDQQMGGGFSNHNNNLSLKHKSTGQFMNSVTSTSSESSFGNSAVFSSSETDTISHNNNNHKTRPRSKTEIRHMIEKSHHHQQQQKQKQKPKREGGSTNNSFSRTKLRALKIYGELNQKVRHPISPGSRIASFLSSIFNSGNVKKAKMCYVGAVEDVTFEHKSKSPCFSSSTASSFSRRSCMSKGSSSSKGNKNNSGVKRCVRFYPVSVILGEEYSHKPCGHRYSSYENNHPSLLPLPSVRNINARSSSSSIKELKKMKNCVNSVAKEKVFQDYGKGNNGKFGFRGFYDNGEDHVHDDDDDALSYSSSDLFELDHIRYQEELPVYETTNLETNKAIANGLCL